MSQLTKTHAQSTSRSEGLCPKPTVNGNHRSSNERCLVTCKKQPDRTGPENSLLPAPHDTAGANAIHANSFFSVVNRHCFGHGDDRALVRAVDGSTKHPFTKAILRVFRFTFRSSGRKYLEKYLTKVDGDLPAPFLERCVLDRLVYLNGRIVKEYMHSRDVVNVSRRSFWTDSGSATSTPIA